MTPPPPRRLATPVHRLRLVTAIAGMASVALLACGAPESATETPLSGVAIKQLSQTPGQTERDGAFSPDGQWIVYGVGTEGSEHIWKRPTAGGEPVQLTSGDAEHLYPAWSPDGTRILFTSNRSGQDNVWTIGADGRGLCQVTSDTDSVAWRRNHLAAWSPDSRQIAFVGSRGGEVVNGSAQGGQRDLFLIAADGGEAMQITDTAEMDEEHPVWSPDGTAIVFARGNRRASRDGPPSSDLVVIDLATRQERTLVSHPGTDQAPTWSPDGRWIAFNSGRSGVLSIWLVPAAGGTAIPVTDDRFAVVPRWSPDGRRLVFNAIDLPTPSIVDADGSNPRRLLIDGFSGYDVRWSADQTGVLYLGPGGELWQYDIDTGTSRNLSIKPMRRRNAAEFAPSPDGRFIAYAAVDPSQRTQLWLYPTAGGTPRQVTASDRDHLHPQWSPDGRTLSFSSDRTIWTVPANGGVEQRVLPNFDKEHWRATWSRDGTRLAFEVAEEEGHIVYTAALDGSDLVRLQGGHSPTWSPDGSRLLIMPPLVLLTPGLRQIPATGGAVEVIFDDGTAAAEPKYSPDGSQILFIALQAADLFVADVGPLLDAQVNLP
ncbi:MAG: hypothetical protein HOE86_26960 [Gemmatimonadetes bacterium]|nr:hypothetical protein [Gemmatimonadota bacterium]